jgi:hypothetical protein
MRWIIALVAVAFVGWSSPAFAFGSCRTEGYLPRFDARLASSLPTECREIVRTNIVTRSRRVPIRMIHFGATPGIADADTVAHFRALSGALGPALDRLGDVDLAQTTILLTALEPATATASGDRAYAFAAGWEADDECTVVFYKPEALISRDYFMTSLAHEIFHCVQGKTWPLKTKGYPENAWWIEGSAVYFSSLVAPDTTLLDGFAARFDETSPTTALIDMRYDASVFFWWLHQRVGPLTGVWRFIEAMADERGRDAQLAAVRAAAPIDRYTEFAQDYLDARIRMPNGRAIPSNVRVPTTTAFTGPRSKSSSVEPYVLGREYLLFREGKSYDLKTVVDSGRSRFKEEGGGDWGDPPTQVNACEEDKQFLVALLTTGESAIASFIVTDAEELDRRACCLIGEWQPTAEALQGWVSEAHEIGGPAVAGAGGSLSCSYGGGDWIISFGGDGKGSVRWNDLVNSCVTSGPGGSMVQTMTRFGAYKFNWALIDDRGGSWTVTDSDVAWRYVMEIGPMRQERIMDEGWPSVSGGFAYQCTDETLNIKGMIGLSHREYDHNRFGGPPRP